MCNDLVLCTISWETIYLNYVLSGLASVGSNHFPIIIDYSRCSKNS